MLDQLSMRLRSGLTTNLHPVRLMKLTARNPESKTLGNCSMPKSPYFLLKIMFL